MIEKMLEEINRIMKPYKVYAVGGCVRDYLLGVEPKDYDFCTDASPVVIEKKIKSKSMRAYLTGKRFGTLGCKVKIDGKYYFVEITTFRTEQYEEGNRKPKVKFVKTITEDLSRRDFSINAMAIRLNKNGKVRIIDPFNGQEDLKNKIIRCVNNPKLRFKEDSLRMLRCIRFACRFGFKIEKKTLEKMKKMSVHLLDISKERWMMELDKILQSKNVRLGLELLWEIGAFKWMIPELVLQSNYDQNSQYHNWKLDCHTINVVQAIRNDTDDLNLLWAGLLHDIAKPFVRTDKVTEVNDGDFILGNNPKIKPNNKIFKTNYINHEILGAEMVDRIATHLKWSKERREKVVELVRNHLEEDCPLRRYDNLGK